MESVVGVVAILESRAYKVTEVVIQLVGVGTLGLIMLAYVSIITSTIGNMINSFTSLRINKTGIILAILLRAMKM